jgi:hypothetical protein
MGLAILSFNNRGAERGTEDEKFRACLADLDAAAEFARRRGLPETGLHRPQHRLPEDRLLAGPAAAPRGGGTRPAGPGRRLRGDPPRLGRRYETKVAWARKQVAAGKPGAPVTGLYERFSAARFLSVADPRATEANVFRYDGALTQFRRVRCPVYAVFGSAEEFAAIPPADMLAILRRKTRSAQYNDWLIPGANHSFKECEAGVARTVCEWARGVAP